MPWSRSLKGLRVLVVHAFADSIARQYRENRGLLFSDPQVLPEFELQCLKAPQTMLGETAGFSCWSEALADLKKRVDALDYDVAIIGCGAYENLIGFIDHVTHPQSEAAGSDSNPYYQNNFRAYNAWAKRNGLEPIPAPPYLLPGIGHVWGIRDAMQKLVSKLYTNGTH